MKQTEKVIFKILSHLEKRKNFDYIDIQPISATGLGITDNLWADAMHILIVEGYIEGVNEIKVTTSTKPSFTNLRYMKITYKGIEYLNNYTFFKRIINFFADISKLKIK